MLRKIRLDDGSLLHDAFAVNACGRDLRAGNASASLGPAIAPLVMTPLMFALG
jgi:hypothetical protein